MARLDHADASAAIPLRSPRGPVKQKTTWAHEFHVGQPERSSPAPGSRLHTVDGSQGHAGVELKLIVGLKASLLVQRGQDEDHLHHREVVPDTDAPAAAEREKGEPVGGGTFHEPARIEDRRPVPEPWIAVHDPLREDEL